MSVCLLMRNVLGSSIMTRTVPQLRSLAPVADYRWPGSLALETECNGVFISQRLPLLLLLVGLDNVHPQSASGSFITREVALNLDWLASPISRWYCRMLCNSRIHVRKAEVELEYTPLPMILQLPMQGSWLTEARACTAWVTKL
jgi:hypothetical protein